MPSRNDDPRAAKHPQRGVITKSVGGTRVAQLVSTAFRTSKKSRTIGARMRWRRATGSRTPRARRWGSRRRSRSAASGRPGDRTTAAVCPSYCAEMTSVGMLLSRDVADDAVDRRHVPDVAVGAHEREVGRILVDRTRERRERALSRGFDALLGLVGHPLGAGDAVEEPVAEDADAGGIEPRTRPRWWRRASRRRARGRRWRREPPPPCASPATPPTAPACRR